MPKPVTQDTQSTQVKPDPALEKRSRRIFNAEYKLRIVHEADACKHGELSALLCREKLYHNQIQQWRREFAEGGLDSLSKSAPGPKPKDTPERFVKGQSQIKFPPQIVTINPLYREDGTIETEHGVNFPTLTAAKDRANAKLH